MRSGADGIGEKQYKQAQYGTGMCLRRAEANRLPEWTAWEAPRRCEQSNEEWGKDGIGEKRYKQTQYGTSTCLVCAGANRLAAWTAWGAGYAVDRAFSLP